MPIRPARSGRVRRVGAVVAAVLLCLLGLTVGDQAAASASASAHGKPRPTVVLVHGAFADASSWNGVVTRLQKRGYRVVAPALGMRGLASDSAYLASLLSQIKGPVGKVYRRSAGFSALSVEPCSTVDSTSPFSVAKAFTNTRARTFGAVVAALLITAPP